MSSHTTNDATQAAGWTGADQALNQSDVDNLLDGPDREGSKRRGLEVLLDDASNGLERLTLLPIVTDHLAQLMTIGIRSFIADHAEISIPQIRSSRLKDFLDGVPFPALIAVLRIEPWGGYCLAALDPHLISATVDIRLGGRRNNSAPIEGRPYTLIERALIDRLINEIVAPGLVEAFGIACDADFVLERFETTPSYAAVTRLTAASVVFRALVSLEQTSGWIDFLIPLESLDPVRDRLAQKFVRKKQNADHGWRSHLLAALPTMDVPLRAIIERRPISSAEVMSWKVGSRLELLRRHEEPIDVCYQNIVLFRATIAQQNGQIALCVAERRLDSDLPSSTSIIAKPSSE